VSNITTFSRKLIKVNKVWFKICRKIHLFENQLMVGWLGEQWHLQATRVWILDLTLCYLIKEEYFLVRANVPIDIAETLEDAHRGRVYVCAFIRIIAGVCVCVYRDNCMYVCVSIYVRTVFRKKNTCLRTVILTGLPGMYALCIYNPHVLNRISRDCFTI
jgi:hypothetical protein